MTQDPAKLRSISFVGHPSSGKTSLVDTLAHALGAAERRGSVADKTSICDTEPEEQDKGHTLQSKVVHASKGGQDWNLIDTPGYPDFMAETISAIFASDVVVGVVSCSSGVTFNLRKKMETAKRLGRGRMILLTHLDGENADFDEIVMALRDGVGEVCVPYLLPDQSGAGFSSVSRSLANPEVEWRKRLMDRVMDACEDEDVVMEYLESEELTDDVLEKHLPGAVTAGALVPILICNPETGTGIPELIEFCEHFAPTAATEGAYKTSDGDLANAADGPLTGVVINVRSDPHVGRICTARVLSGQLSNSDVLVGADSEDKGEKMGGLFHIVGGKKRENITSAGPGEIVAFTKVEKLGAGETFTTTGNSVAQVEFPALPLPTVSLSVFPKSRADEQKIGEALNKLIAEDPSFQIEHVALTHELVIHGMSDLHLQVMEARLKRRYGVEIETKLPRIAYRETVTKPSEGHHRHKKQSGGRGQFGECYVRMRPAEKGAGIVFIDKVVGGSIPRNLIPAIEKGAREIAAQGILTNSTVVDVEFEVYDGKFHAVDSDEASFKMAGARAFKDAFMKAGPALQEPVMEVDIHIPSSDAGTVFSDITSQRRGHVIDQESDGTITTIKAHVPLSTMQTYFRDLKSQTAGEGSYAMRLDHYGTVPSNEAQKIVAEIVHANDDE